jgi:hypothetical protein
MNRKDQTSRRPAIGLIVLAGAAVLTCGASGIAMQSRLIRPRTAANKNHSVKQQRVATLQATDSPEGSRVSLTADQSLDSYEAYRRGDRFYVKIPPIDVPRAEIVRGRGFADVKVLRRADSTVISFRLPPGAKARVEQYANKLDVVFTMPRARPSAPAATFRKAARSDGGPAPPVNSNLRTSGNPNTPTSTKPLRTSSDRNTADLLASAAARPSPTLKLGPSPASSTASATTKATPTPQLSIEAMASPLAGTQAGSPSATPTPGVQQPVQSSTWNNLKERARYWILLAQLNPLLVGIGAATLLLLIGLLFFLKRRARTNRPLHPDKDSIHTNLGLASYPSKPSTASQPVDLRGATRGTVASVAATTSGGTPAKRKPATPKPDSVRHERLAVVSEEVKKIMAGGDYDESIIASDDPETRQLVGAELLSALVGRNLQRRERARAAFMKHGYFDDATRDLRTAESSNERAAAARRLSFVHEREATPHLVEALDDPSADVRRSAVEALTELKDPAAIAPLSALMQTETDRKVPRTLIKHAIEACAISGSDGSPVADAGAAPISSAAAVSETEREVIEI